MDCISLCARICECMSHSIRHEIYPFTARYGFTAIIILAGSLTLSSLSCFRNQGGATSDRRLRELNIIRTTVGWKGLINDPGTKSCLGRVDQYSPPLRYRWLVQDQQRSSYGQAAAMRYNSYGRTCGRRTTRYHLTTIYFGTSLSQFGCQLV
jgi:hypothetical protein